MRVEACFVDHKYSHGIADVLVLIFCGKFD